MEKKIWIKQAQYNWLIGNPTFQTIPQGYVIHHLDSDKLNDDVSNLVLMLKSYHLSYHAKTSFPKQEVKLVGLTTDGIPRKKPKAYKKYGGKRWYLQWYLPDNIRPTRTSLDGKGFRTKEEAERAIEKIFPFCEWDEDGYLKKE